MLKQLVRSAFGVVLFAAFVATSHAQLNLAAPLPMSPLATNGKLPNGLSYYIQKNARPANKLELRLVVKAGSILEDEDQLGMAHFLEHMAFNGSTHFKKQELVSYLESIGVKFGADLNAYTSFDETVYILPIPTARRENVDKGFQVLRDWAGGLTLDTRDIDDERGIVLEELRIGKGASDRMRKVLLPKMFNGSRYAQRLPIGTEAIIGKGDPSALRRFYKDWYRPDLMAVVVVGDIDNGEAERLVRKHFADLKNPARPRERFEAPISALSETEALIITDKEANGNTLLLRYPVKETRPGATIGSYRADLVKILFTAMLNARLQELTQLANPPFMGAASSVSNLTARYEAYSVSASLGKGGATPAIEALVQEHARASQFGFTGAELEREKKNLLRHIERAYSERDKTESSAFVREFVDHFLAGESMPGIENEYHYMRELVPGIGLEEVNRYTRDAIPTDAPKLVAYMGAARSELPTPTGEQLLAAFKAADQLAVKAREEKTFAASLMDKPPAAGKIVSEVEDKRIGTTTLTLSNGVKVILKPTDFRNDQVILSAVRYGGQSLFGEADALNARYASTIAAAMGTGAFSPLDLRKMMAGQSAGVATSLGIYTETVGGTSGSSEIETMLQLLYLEFSAPRRDPELFQSLVGKQREAARNAMAQPETVFRDTIAATLYAKHPRRARVPRPEDFAKLDLDRALAIHKERFSSAKDMSFILAGSFDPVKVRPLIATYMASLPTPDIDLGFRDIGLHPVTGIVKKEVRAGVEDKSRISISFTGPAEFSEDEQMRLNAMIDVMNIRIVDILREKMALIYGGGMEGSLSRIPKENYAISVSMPTGPASVDKVIATLLAEIERMKADGPNEAELERVRQVWLQNHQKSLRENGYWVARLQASLMNGTDPARILDYEKRVTALTADELRNAARRYFDMNNYVQLVLYPEK